MFIRLSVPYSSHEFASRLLSDYAKAKYILAFQGNEFSLIYSRRARISTDTENTNIKNSVEYYIISAFLRSVFNAKYFRPRY